MSRFDWVSGISSKRKVSSDLRQALWLAHGRRCAYTSEPLEFRDLHIDHILPERLENALDERAQQFEACRLSSDFDIYGPMNMVPVQARANLQKGGRAFSPSRSMFFLEIAERRAPDVEKHLKRITRRREEDNVRVSILRLHESGALSTEQFAVMLENLQTSSKPPFELLKQLSFADGELISSVRIEDVEALRGRNVSLGGNTHISGVELSHSTRDKKTVYTCREYDEAIAQQYFPYTTFDMKMATFFTHQCGLLAALEVATTPLLSYLKGPPRTGVTDLNLLPYDLFPHTIGGLSRRPTYPGVSFQDKVNDGTLTISRVSQNLEV